MKANKLLWAIFVSSFVLIGGVLGNEFFNFYSELPVISDVIKDSPSSRLALQAATIIVFLPLLLSRLLRLQVADRIRGRDPENVL